MTWLMPILAIASGRKSVDALVVEQDLAAADLSLLGGEQSGDGLQSSGLASAVRADQRDDLPVSHLQRDAVQYADDAQVRGFDVVHPQHLDPRPFAQVGLDDLGVALDLVGRAFSDLAAEVQHGDAVGDDP